MTIRTKSFVALGALTLVLALLAVWAASMFIHRIMFTECRDEAEIMLYAMKAVRSHTKKVVRPEATEMVGPDGFVTELQSSSFAANGVFSLIDPSHRHGLTFRTASIKPHNPKNQANQVESRIIARLDRMYAAGENPFWEGVREIEGEKYFIMAQGELNYPGCMRCHGDPADAPNDLKRRYPASVSQGYGHVPGRIESAEIVTIPFSDVEKSIGAVQKWVLLASGLGFLILLAGIHIGLSVLFRPIVAASEVAGLIADGNLAQAAHRLNDEAPEEGGSPKEQKDETGRLMGAFNTMTRGLRSLIGQVQKSGIQVTSTATEIAASALQLDSTVSQQAASTAQVSATCREIRARAEDLVHTMDDLAAMSAESADLAARGRQGLASMETTMGGLVTGTTDISAKLSAISSQAEQIGQVTETINKVAAKTNLLSLNAAIEAEKAGEFGRGFSVVATEVRNLADQTSAASQNIERMISAMRSSVSSGVMEMDKFEARVSQGVEAAAKIGVQLSKVIESAQAFAPLFAQANGDVAAQGRGAAEIDQAMNDLAQTARHTSEALSEFHQATEQLKEAAQGLREEVTRFHTED